LIGGEDHLKTLLVRGLGGDSRAYQAFLAELGRHLRGFLRRRLVRWPDEVEDLVQETLLAVHNQRHTFDTAQPVTAWAYAIARYKLVDALRRRARTDALNDPLDDATELFAVTDDAPAAARRDVGRLLDTLPEKQRAAIVLTKLDGLSVAEAAARVGMSESAIKVSVHRGLKALAARLRGPVDGH
jgi:RNA polymerase sigma-70 factor (ECF subfamily)